MPDVDDPDDNDYRSGPTTAIRQRVGAPAILLLISGIISLLISGALLAVAVTNPTAMADWYKTNLIDTMPNGIMKEDFVKQYDLQRESMMLNSPLNLGYYIYTLLAGFVMPTEPLEEDDDLPYARRHEAAADNDEYQLAWPEYARMRTFGPGVGSIIVGVIGILLGIFMCTFLVDIYRKQFEIQREQIDKRPGISDQQKSQMLSIQKSMTDVILVSVPIYGGFTILVGVLTLLSGWLLIRVKSRWFGITMAVVNLIPCTATCFYTIPLGIWMLVVLNNAEVIAKMRGLRTPDDV